MHDVISFPAAPTQSIIEQYLVHTHPYPRSYQPAKLIALRRERGVMNRLYRTERELILRPGEPIAPQVQRLSLEQQQRLLGYIEARQNSFGFAEAETYKFYLLEVAYELRHLPRTSQPLRAHTYYQLEELLSGKPFVLHATARRRR